MSLQSDLEYALRNVPDGLDIETKAHIIGLMIKPGILKLLSDSATIVSESLMDSLIDLARGGASGSALVASMEEVRSQAKPVFDSLSEVL